MVHSKVSVPSAFRFGRPSFLSHAEHPAQSQATSICWSPLSAQTCPMLPSSHGSAGLAVGTRVGVGDVGEIVGAEVWATLGATVGTADGPTDGATEGTSVGAALGAKVGTALGAEVGTPLGRVGLVGASLGATLGTFDGLKLGARVGTRDGAAVGVVLGEVVGASVTFDGRRVGAAVFLHMGWQKPYRPRLPAAGPTAPRNVGPRIGA